MDKPIRLMTGDEYDRFYEATKQAWKGQSIKDLETGMRFNQRVSQQVNIKIQVIQELLDERTRDKKSNQFAD
jgi:hypothetical protein